MGLETMLGKVPKYLASSSAKVWFFPAQGNGPNSLAVPPIHLGVFPVHYATAALWAGVQQHSGS